MSTGVVVLAFVGLAVGANVLLVALVLLNRVLRPVREIKRYTDEILVSGLAIARNLDDVDEAVRTRELVAALPPALAPLAENLGAP